MVTTTNDLQNNLDYQDPSQLTQDAPNTVTQPGEFLKRAYSSTYSPRYTWIAHWIMKQFILKRDEFLLRVHGRDSIKFFKTISKAAMAYLASDLAEVEKKTFSHQPTVIYPKSLIGEVPQVPELTEQILSQFTIYDEEVVIESKHATFSFPTRVIESNDGTLRLIAWGYYGNFHRVGNTQAKKPWFPLCREHLAAPVLELLAHYKNKFEKIDSVLPYSLGASFLGAPHLLENTEIEDLLPNTIILNRCLASIKKATEKLYPLWPEQPKLIEFLKINWLFHVIVRFFISPISMYYVDVDPETGLFKLLGNTLTKRDVVQIKVTNDRYFSDAGDFDPNFINKISSVARRILVGIFTNSPEDPEAIHSTSFRNLVYHPSEEGSDISKYTPMEPYKENVPDTLIKEVLSTQSSENRPHNALLIGGSLDDIDSIFVQVALPLMAAHVKKQASCT